CWQIKSRAIGITPDGPSVWMNCSFTSRSHSGRCGEGRPLLVWCIIRIKTF
ncbi:MAG: hypothetical protein AVDCRST_MAG93-5670, partial [uncultured Chloroflexia bacterium]